MELLPDPRRSGGWTLLADGVEQSYVDPARPRHLAFEYVRLIAAVLDAAAPAGAPLRVLHLGGGALTLPRYVAATRPGSPQRVVEADPAVVALVGAHLPWPPEIHVVVGDARDAVHSPAERGHDVVVADVFQGARTPAGLAGTGFYAAVAAVLRPGGLLVVNVADVPPLAYARTQVATARTAFGQLALLGAAATLRGRRAGNVVLVAGTAPQLRQPAGTRRLHGEELVAFAAGARPVPDPPRPGPQRPARPPGPQRPAPPPDPPGAGSDTPGCRHAGARVTRRGDTPAEGPPTAR